MAYIEPKYADMANEIISWYEDISSRSNNKYGLYDAFFSDFSKVTGNSINRRAMAFTLFGLHYYQAASFEHWVRFNRNDIGCIVRSFKTVRRFMKRNPELIKEQINRGKVMCVTFRKYQERYVNIDRPISRPISI